MDEDFALDGVIDHQCLNAFGAEIGAGKIRCC